MGILSNFNFLLKRYSCYPRGDFHFFTAFSAENVQSFSPTLDLCLPGSSKVFHYVAGSINGILCVDDKAGNIIFWNPSNGSRKKLPQSCLKCPSSADLLIFYCSGFGFDSRSKDYKVIRFVESRLPDKYGSFDLHRQVEVYSYKSDSWTEISPAPDVYAHYDVSTYINGVYYWLAFDENGTVIVLSFDFVDEKFSRINLPDFLLELFETHFLDLLDFNGLLAIVVYQDTGIEKSFGIWVMNGDESWANEWYIDRIFGVERPLGFWENGEKMFLESLNHELMLYDRATGKLKSLGILDNTSISHCPTTMELIPYVESSELEEHAPQASTPPPAPASASTAVSVTKSAPVASSTATSESDVSGQAASNLVAGSNLEGASCNNPERAVEYFYSESTHTSSPSKRKENILLEQPPSKAPRADHEEVFHFLGTDRHSLEFKWYVLDVYGEKLIADVKMPDDVPCGSTAIAYLNCLYLIWGDDKKCISHDMN